jgi:hypothetical protein
MNDTAVAEKPALAAKPTPAFKVLSANVNIDGADFKRTYRQVIVDAGTTLEDVLRPGFWRNHASKIGVLDLIDVISADGSLDAQLRVSAKEPGLLHFRVLRAFEREERQTVPTKEVVALGEVPDNYTVTHTPATSWRVWSKSPSLELVRGLKSKVDATNWAIDHAKRAGGL